jgi:hypothetical protein
MKNPGMRIRQPKARGEWAELCFMTRAAELGLCVTKPWGDNAPYDFAVDHNGHFLRIQVKCTCKKRSRSFICSVSNSRGPYSAAQIDFVAAFIIPIGTGTSCRSLPSAAPSTSGSPSTAKTPATPNS